MSFDTLLRIFKYDPTDRSPDPERDYEKPYRFGINILRLLRNRYLIQAGATDSRVGNIEFDDNLMGELMALCHPMKWVLTLS